MKIFHSFKLVDSTAEWVLSLTPYRDIQDMQTHILICNLKQCNAVFCPNLVLPYIRVSRCLVFSIFDWVFLVSPTSLLCVSIFHFCFTFEMSVYPKWSVCTSTKLEFWPRVSPAQTDLVYKHHNIMRIRHRHDFPSFVPFSLLTQY